MQCANSFTTDFTTEFTTDFYSRSADMQRTHGRTYAGVCWRMLAYADVC